MKENYSMHRFAGLISFLSRIRIPSKIILITVGIISTAWFLFRVIPKPSRVHYPCMRATAPLASSFVAYLIGITGFTLFFRKARQKLYQSRYLVAFGFVILGLVAGAWTVVNTNKSAIAAYDQPPQEPNQPEGIGIGIFPGRVVWSYNPEATNENCSNSTNDFWYMDQNTDQAVVDDMLSWSIQKLTGTTNDVFAWDSIFHYYNRTHGRGNTGYLAGEKIVIKINLNGINNSSPNRNINTSPQACYAILDQLVNVAGVAQTDISIGDPNCSMNQATYSKCHTGFPDVTYWGSGAGLVTAAPTTNPVLFASDGSFSDKLPQAYVNATYMINMPVFKKHHRAGISIACKNHFGSIGAYTGGAWHLHPSLPAPETSDVTNGEYGVYRCFVDIMGHEDLGGKTILYLVDGLWGSTNWGHPPVKWHMVPFNDDWPSSLFVSIDPVATESVCYDFLYEEFDIDQSETLHPQEGGAWSDNAGPFSHFEGADDFLHQAANPDNWPAGIDYDPENDGSILTSMGTHEHWNNALDKMYSRNLGLDTGIELFRLLTGGTYTIENSDLLSNMVTCIYVDSFDVKWFGTSMGISRFDGDTWTDVTSDNHLLDNNIKDIAYERTGYGHEIWAATDSGLAVMGFNIDGVTSATTYNTNNSGILGNNVQRVGVDIRHNRWAATPEGISIYRGSDWYDTTSYYNEDHNWLSLTELTITSFGSYDKDSMMFVTTNGAGALRYDFDLIDGYTGASAMGEQWSGLESNNVNTVTIVDTIQFYGTPEGAFRHDGNEVKQNWLWYPVDSFVSSNVTAIEVDDEGNIWFGTDMGISIKTALGWLKFPSGVQASAVDAIEGLTEADITWTNGNGLGEENGIIDGTVNDIRKDFSGNIWVATNGGIEYFTEVPGVPVESEAMRVVFITEGNSGSVLPDDGTTYTANTAYGSGSEADDWYCVYNGTGSSVTITGLTPNTTYRIMVCEYTGTAGDEVYASSTSTGNPANFTTLPVAIELNGKEPVSVHPVPFNDYLIINFEDLNSGSTASFYSLDGKLQYSVVLSGAITRINTSDLKAGGYVLNVRNGNESYTMKIVK